MGDLHPDALSTGFLLHRRDYSDTSLLLEVFTAEHGRFPLLAKGAKRGRTPRSALLQPFQPLLLAWSGRGEVRTLRRVEAAGRPWMLAGNALYCGFYLNELLMRLLQRQDAHEGLFAQYQATLCGLAGGEPIDDLLRQFELRLLAELGYAPILDLEADGATPVRADAWYLYLPEQGLVLQALEAERATDPRFGAALQVAEANAVSDVVVGMTAIPPGLTPISGETLLALSCGQPLVGRQIREARRLLRQLLSPHLGERPLKSRELFRGAAQQGSASNRAG